MKRGKKSGVPCPHLRAIWLVPCLRPPVDSGGDPVPGGVVPAGEGVAERLTAIRVAYRGPIHSRRNTIYAIVPHYED